MTKRIFFFIATTVFMLSSCDKENVEDIIPEEPVANLFINEVYSGNPNWIELYNNSDSETNISGFVLQNNNEAAQKYTIPSGTKIAAKSFLVIDAFTFDISSINGVNATA
ncbi:hypothetical protein EZS27_037334 [termite gut metagenome]|uniref:LTD domain-containing protein n=1 Tax=termite gut metagenome TaxID=433724 RepID=A0A5J4PRU7_9ZZZZ